MKLFLLLLCCTTTTVYGDYLVSFPKYFNYITECYPNERVVVINSFIESNSEFKLNIYSNTSLIYNVTDIFYFQVNKITFDIPFLFFSISCVQPYQRCTLYYSITMNCESYTMDEYFTDNINLIYVETNFTEFDIDPNTIIVNTTGDGNYTISKTTMLTTTSTTTSTTDEIDVINNDMTPTIGIIVGFILTVFVFSIPLITCMYYR